MNRKPFVLGLLLFAAPVLAQAAPQASGGQPPQGRGGKFFDATDTNKDGALSREEWIAAGRKPEGFAMMDLNKDGKVTREEGREAMRKVMEARSMDKGGI